jgi:hypothetical protein
VLSGQIDAAWGRDRVALQAQQVLVAVAALEHHCQRHGEQHYRADRDRDDGDDQAPSHGSSNR